MQLVEGSTNGAQPDAPDPPPDTPAGGPGAVLTRIVADGTVTSRSAQMWTTVDWARTP